MNTSQLLLSIVIAVYNTGSAGKNVLRECIDSIIKQETDKPYEIVCVNDGSNDDSLEILNEYAKVYPNIVVVSQENSGAANAKNNGMYSSKGKYIWIINSDDCIKMGSLNAILEILEINCPDALRIHLKNINENKFSYSLVQHEKEFSYFLHSDFVEPPHDDVTNIIKASIIKDNAIKLRAGMKYHYDRLFGVQCFLNINCKKVAEIRETVYLRRQRNTSEMGMMSRTRERKNAYLSDSKLMAKEYHQILLKQNGIASEMKDFIREQEAFFAELTVVTLPLTTYEKKTVMDELKEQKVYPYYFRWSSIKQAKGIKNKFFTLVKCLFRFEIIYNIFYYLQKNK